ncbi:MAG: DUF368 domain-containing protein [Flavobacteriales bacterium]|nr:DUF368 domain-containing protein [Flavobacteriales bacterium]
MGAADVVPGVSGGTIAFISGIYEELLQSISNINPSVITSLKNEGLAETWKKINGNFLVVLLSGIGTSIVLLAKLVTHLLQYYPVPVWSFFFGLIVASIIYVGKQQKKWNFSSILSLILGAVFVVCISSMPPLSASNSMIFLFFAGFIAVCAMILPGISGSFILLLLGAYGIIMNAVHEFDFGIIVPVAIGAVVGLLTFSKLLSFLLKKFHNTMIGVLVGLLIGSLYKVWPWKTTELVFDKEHNQVIPINELDENLRSLNVYTSRLSEKSELLPYIEKNVSPNAYSLLNQNIDSGLISAIIASLVGFSLIFIIEFIASKKSSPIANS